MPVVISKDGIEVNMSEPNFREAFGEFERKKRLEEVKFFLSLYFLLSSSNP